MKTSYALLAVSLGTFASFVVGCNGEIARSPDGKEPASTQPSPNVNPSPNTPDAPATVSLVETCNALDDDLDDDVDQGDVCGLACSADAVARATQPLRLPRPDDVTVPRGSTVEPHLHAYGTIPAFCTSPVPTTVDDEMNIGCGVTITFPAVASPRRRFASHPGASFV